MNEGKRFEQDFRNSITTDMYYLRIRDNPQSFENTARFTLTNPYDCLIFYKSNLFCLELKSTISTSLSFWKEDSDKSANIKKCQIEGLTDASKHDNIVSGFILNFRNTEHTYFLDIKDFIKFTNKTSKKSINEKDIIEHNGIIIAQHKKRTRYTYQMRNWLDFMTTNGAGGEYGKYDSNDPS